MFHRRRRRCVVVDVVGGVVVVVVVVVVAFYRILLHSTALHCIPFHRIPDPSHSIAVLCRLPMTTQDRRIGLLLPPAPAYYMYDDPDRAFNFFRLQAEFARCASLAR